MRKERNYSHETNILWITLIIVMLVHFKWPHIFGDGSFPIVWISVGIGSLIGTKVRKEKLAYETILFPAIMILNSLIYRLFFIPNYIILVLSLVGCCLYYLWRHPLKHKGLRGALIVISLLALFAVDFQLYSNRLIKDAVLDGIIKREYDLNGTIKAEDLSYRDRLIISNYPINSLRGLENFKALTELRIWNDAHLIKDIEIISQLKRLENLTIGGPDLNKLNELEAMETVKELQLYYPKRGELKVLNSFPNVVKLSLAGFMLEDLKSLSNNKSLEELTISGGQIRSFNGIQELRRLRVLNLSDAHLADIDWVLELNSLEEIVLRDVNLPFQEDFIRKATEKGITIKQNFIFN